MSEGLGILTLLAELFLIIQCLQISFKQKVKFDRYMISIIIADICIYMGINYSVVPTMVSVLFYILLWRYCYKEFNLTVGNTTIRMIAGVSLLGCIEVIIGYITNRYIIRDDKNLALFISGVLALLLATILKWNIVLPERKTKYKRTIGTVAMIILYGLTLIGLLMNYYLNHSLIKLYVVVILFFIVIIFGNLYKLEQAQNEINTKNYELELQRVYGETYKELLEEVRRRQHDYKNQLAAIYSMHLTAGSLEELVEMQQEYGNILKGNCRYDSVLTGCSNQILAGYLYYRCISCENEGIGVEVDICVEQADCFWAIHEIIELLGILIDNACESVLAQQDDNKCIQLVVRETWDKIVLTVSNPTRYITFSEIEKMFKNGYSSKGDNRGMGLARVLELVKKYRAELKVFNKIFEEKNWIEFTIEITK